jgi:hypothetical protein
VGLLPREKLTGLIARVKPFLNTTLLPVKVKGCELRDVFLLYNRLTGNPVKDIVPVLSEELKPFTNWLVIPDKEKGPVDKLSE